MSDNVDSLILEHLRALRDGQARIEAELKDVKLRISSLESTVLSLRRDMVGMQDDVYRQNAVIEGIKERLDRIERHMSLIP